MWLDPDVISDVMSRQITPQEHTYACKTLVDDTAKPLCEMDYVDQDFVLECGHRSHLSVRQLFRVWSDAPLSREIEEGKLF